eukprot:CAMPEP_0169120760 /NCGR_PEP_ID=MMETSP1015-20121227/32285_1 /TAXON_ID=342587 /ORGANISM="Karlodinium micrum, Strain CCMP2283" /LENGTH=42 /DNA_ID= /DNA_START= /DNA_END= /DNA_ORIENTATION=
MSAEDVVQSAEEEQRIDGNLSKRSSASPPAENSPRGKGDGDN